MTHFKIKGYTPKHPNLRGLSFTNNRTPPLQKKNTCNRQRKGTLNQHKPLQENIGITLYSIEGKPGPGVRSTSPVRKKKQAGKGTR